MPTWRRRRRFNICRRSSLRQRRFYASGVYRIRRRVGDDRVVTRWQTLAFSLAAIQFVVALSQPVDDITDALFSAHMAQHLVLMLIIPPLVVWSWPVVVGFWAFPHEARKILSNSARPAFCA